MRATHADGARWDSFWSGVSLENQKGVSEMGSRV